MKTFKHLLQVFILMIYISSVSRAQVPASYEFSLRNDVQVSQTVYQFDIYLLNKDLVNVFELDLYQAGILVNPAIVNGGAITASIVPGSSQLVALQQPTTGITFESNCIKLANPSVVSHGSGTIISTTSPGVRIATIRLTNTEPFGRFSPNLTFNFTASPYNTAVYAFNQTSPFLGVNLTNQADFTVSNLTNEVLNGSLFPLTINGVTAGNKVYDGTTNEILNTAGASLVGVQSGDVVNLISTGATASFADKNVGTAKVVTTAGFTLSGADANKYFLTQPLLTANILPANLTISGVTANNKIYDATTAATLNTGSAVLAGVLGTDNVTLNSLSAAGTFVNKNVGTAKTVMTSGFTLSGADAGNYILTQPTLTANITPADLNIIFATANDKVYDGTTTATLVPGSGFLSGVLGTDNVSLVTSGATGTFLNKNVGTAKTVITSGYTINGPDAGNYTLIQPTLAANITPASLTISGVTANKVYDGTTNVTLNINNVVLVGVFAPDVVTLKGANTGTFTDKNVGNNKPVLTSFTLGGADAGNYTLIQPSVTGNITPKDLTIIANNLSKCYGTVVTFTGTEFTSVGLVFGDYINSVNISSIGASASAPANTIYSIVPAFAVGAYLNNYNITYVNGTLTVMPLPPLPMIKLAGNNACLFSADNIYSTQGGMTGYNWTVSGGTITAGGTASDSTITVTWDTSGIQMVSVIYSDTNGCSASSAASVNITVNPLPVPSITGPNASCTSSSGNVYFTEPGMTNYKWNISSGGKIISGGISTDDSVTVMWNKAGNQTVSVNYTDMNGCTALNASVDSISIDTLLVPVIKGPNNTCANYPYNTYTTQTGMSDYMWTVSPGGTITSGGDSTSNSITITWNTTGNNSVSVNFTGVNGCLSKGKAVYPVMVHPLPVPTLTGPSKVCEGTSGNMYVTEGGKSIYFWTISAGGTITAGGSAIDSTITVTWDSAGTQMVSVNYWDMNSCTAAIATNYNVTVNPTPNPTITGPGASCISSSGIVYTTEPGMTNYLWTISPGGTIIAGGSSTDNSVTVAWNTAGNQTVDVNYDENGCSAVYSTEVVVTVDSTLVPVINGPNTVCLNNPDNIYTTQPGMLNYTWTVSQGGIITAGGTPTSNSITITWDSTGNRFVKVNFESNDISCLSTGPVVYPLYVYPLPVPTITSTDSIVCAGTTSTYYTEFGMYNYNWVVSRGGTIVGGGTSTDNTVTVMWDTAGIQKVSVNYLDYYFGCMAANMTDFKVTVNPLPVPIITGPGASCLNSPGIIYTTEPGMTNYEWITYGGTITSGGTTSDNSATIDWNMAGIDGVSVIYTNANGCTAATPTLYTVIADTLLVPILSGPGKVCMSSTDNIYTTQSGMINYNWTVSTGAIITAGGTPASNTISITWTTAGNHSVSVNFSGSDVSCKSAGPVVYPVTVDSLPVPTITGDSILCGGTTAAYVTEIGMSNYSWSVNGGTILNGGTSSDYYTIVTWDTTGTHEISVNYMDAGGCMAAVPTVHIITVYPLPMPTITGPIAVCAGTKGNVYMTQSGMTDYTWMVSSGGTITSGGSLTDTTVTITWDTAGMQNVSVNYINIYGCMANSAIIYNVTVNPLPMPTITGPVSICNGTKGNVYKTQSGMTNYNWMISSGGIKTSGGSLTDTTITITWDSAGSQKVSVNYMNVTGCMAAAATAYNVTVNPLPMPIITGPVSICAGTTDNVYTTESGMTNYTWMLSSGGIKTSGGSSTDNMVTVTWDSTGAQDVSVNYINMNGCMTTTETIKNILVNAKPPMPVITQNIDMLISSEVTGNQWYSVSTGLIQGAIGQNYAASLMGSYYDVVTQNGCSSDTSNHVIITGVENLDLTSRITVYPNPSKGHFIASINYPNEAIFTLMIYNAIGEQVTAIKDINVSTPVDRYIDMSMYPPGIYSMIFTTGNLRSLKTVIIQK